MQHAGPIVGLCQMFLVVRISVLTERAELARRLTSGKTLKGKTVKLGKLASSVTRKASGGDSRYP